jgi:TonB family protein
MTGSRLIGSRVLIAVALLAWNASVSAVGPLADLADPAHPLPKVRSMGRAEDYYPPEARRKQIQGEVLVAISIDTTGRVTQPHVLYSDNSLLANQSLKLLSRMQFDVPSDWDNTTQTWRRFRVLVRFRLGNCTLQHL